MRCKCKKLFNTRTELLVHRSACDQGTISPALPLRNLFSSFSSQINNNDSDIDDTPVEDSGSSYFPSVDLPSPVTFEQAAIANEAESLLLEFPYEKTSDVRKSKKQALKKKLNDIQKLVEIWKKEKKLAVKQGNSNKARRLSQKIKNLKSQQPLPPAKEKAWSINDIGDQFTTEVKNARVELGVSTSSPNTSISLNSELASSCTFPSTEIDTVEVEEHSDPIPESSTVEHKNGGLKKSGGRKKNFCRYCNAMKTNYSRHVEIVHPESEEGIELKKISNNNNLTPKEKKKFKMLATERLKKRSNSEYNSQIIHESLNSDSELHSKSFVPVRSRNKKNLEENLYHNYIQCSHCLGLYLRRKFSVHLKNCSANETLSRTPTKSPTKRINAIKEHSVILTALDPKLDEQFKEEILNNMIGDEISSTVRNDPLILKMGQEFHKSRRHSSERNYCSREMRDLGRLLIQLRKQNKAIHTLEDSFNPTHFGEIVNAVEVLNGYDKSTGKVKVVGLAYRLLQPLQQCLLLLRKQRIEELSVVGSDRSRLEMLNDFIQLIKDHWSNQLGRHSTKSMKELRSLKIPKIALEEDIKKLCTFLICKYDSAIALVDEHPSNCSVYDELLDTLVSHIMCLARRRPVDLTRGTLKHLNLIDNNDDLLSMLQQKDMDPKDIENCKNFNIFFVPGKKYEKVPIVLTMKMKEALDCLVRHRSAVGITSELLFVHSKNRSLDATQSLERMKRCVLLKNPKHLTGNGLRHQAATFSKFHSADPLYQDHLATTLGHTLFIHKKNYDLPTSIAQKTIVCPVLHRMTVENESTETNYLGEQEDNCIPIINVKSQNLQIKRMKWNSPEKKEIYKKFGDEILKGVCPKRGDILKWKKNQNILKDRTDASLVTFIHNAAKRKMLCVSPEVKRIKRSLE